MDPRLLYRLVDNLVRNVRNHTPADAAYTIELACEGGACSLVISDGGPGLTDDSIESLNSEGAFSEKAGVGLNLCHRIADLSGLKLLLTGERRGARGKISF